MELRKFEIDGREVEFVNQFRGTRNGFAHDTAMFVDGHKVTEATCHYINRTWEAYTYQSVMLNAVYNRIEELKQYAKDRFMEARGYKKLTADRKAKFEEECKQNAEIAFYEAVREELKRR